MKPLVALIVGAGLLVPAPTLSGQTIAERVARLGDGKVRLSFAARPEVCGNGRNISLGGSVHSRTRRNEDWERECEHGPVRVVLRVEDRRVSDIDVYVGGRWRATEESRVDLGTVAVGAAVGYLMDLARHADDDVGGGALFAASLADSVVLWPQLLELANDPSLPGSTRKTAVFLVGQAAAQAATAGLAEIVYDDEGDREVREAAVFALSQGPPDVAVNQLIDIARTHTDPGIVKSAIFWLGQIDDPRVVAFYEELLTRG
jgi:hypothetical protein